MSVLVDKTYSLPLQIILDEESPVFPTEGQCDCACAFPQVHTIVRETPRNERLIRNPFLQILPLKGDFYVAFVPSNSEVAVISEGIRQILATFSSSKKVIYKGRADSEEGQNGQYANAMRKLASLRFLIPEGTPAFIPPVTREDVLIAWLHVTSQ